MHKLYLKYIVYINGQLEKAKKAVKLVENTLNMKERKK